MGRDVSLKAVLVSQNADYAPVSAVSNRGKSIVHGKEGANEGSHQNVRGVLRDNTAIVASVALFFLWLGITFQVPDFAVDGLEPGLALGSLFSPLGYLSLLFCETQNRFFFCGEDSRSL